MKVEFQTVIQLTADVSSNQNTRLLDYVPPPADSQSRANAHVLAPPSSPPAVLFSVLPPFLQRPKRNSGVNRNLGCRTGRRNRTRARQESNTVYTNEIKTTRISLQLVFCIVAVRTNVQKTSPFDLVLRESGVGCNPGSGAARVKTISITFEQQSYSEDTHSDCTCSVASMSFLQKKGG